ncbi:MAG: DUF5916 domain-containing protein [Balneolaceae bacterium]|nr:DUF5916 domain-containing protein [Balneolaceae bacterium]
MRLQTRLSRLRAAVFVLFCCVVLTTAASGQGRENRQIKAYRLSNAEAFIFDGWVEEQFWSRTDSATGFIMQEPQEGEPATEKTVVRIAYDQNHLYMGMIFYDREPSKIKAYQKRRDARIVSDEKITWIFDTFFDQRNAYFFEINPNALRTDGLITIGQGTSVNLNWDGIWDAKTRIGEFGWSAEVKIPFRTMNFDPATDRWGFNLERVIRRKNETVLWTGYRRGEGIFRPQDAGILSGLSDISQGVGLEVVPYGIARREDAGINDMGDISTSVDGGFDVNYSISPGVKASATFNTDFAEAEVDQRRINLTRFPLFFPEKRDFFLEGANIYEFAPRSGINPFFSRRIGLVGGEPVPITYGARILGTTGGYNMALLHVRTGETNFINPENFTVARVKKNIGAESTVGVIYTRRSTKDDEELSPPLQDRHTFGADLEYSTSRFLSNKNLQFQAFFVFHNTPFSGVDSTNVWDRSSRGIRLNFPNQPWSGHVSYREFGETFSPAVGFTPRNAFRRLQPSIDFTPQLDKSDLIQQMRWGIRYEHLTDLDFNLMTQDLTFTLFGVGLTTGDELRINLSRDYERLQQPFDIKRDGSIIIPVDRYINWVFSTSVETARYRIVSAEVNIETGGFWSGSKDEYGFEINLRPLPGIELAPEYIHTDINLAEGNFSTDLLRFEGNFDFTNSIFLTSTIQFDNLSDVMGMNNRLRWIIQPGSDLFLVYNHNWLQDEGRFTTLQSTGTIKLRYTHRF